MIIKFISFMAIFVSINSLKADESKTKLPPNYPYPCLAGGCFEDGPPKSIKFRSMELVTGPLSCDPKAQSKICKVSYSLPFVMDYYDLEDYCKPLDNGSCPEFETCVNSKLPRELNKDVLKAGEIFKKLNVTEKNHEKLFKKLSKDDLNTLIAGINKLDVNLLKGFPPKYIKDIEEFKNLPLDQQQKALVKPRAYYMAAAIVAGGVAAYYATGWAANAYQDSLFGNDHLRNVRDKEIEKKVNDDKQFDLKD